MRGLCLDTNAYSEFMRGVEAAVALVESAEQVWMPFVVLGELRAGFLKGSRSGINEAELSEFLASSQVAIAHAGDATSRLYARVFDTLRRQGKPIPTNDLWVAACALEHHAALFSFDAHFNAVEGLRTVSAPRDWR